MGDDGALGSGPIAKSPGVGDVCAGDEGGGEGGGLPEGGRAVVESDQSVDGLLVNEDRGGGRGRAEAIGGGDGGGVGADLRVSVGDDSTLTGPPVAEDPGIGDIGAGDDGGSEGGSLPKDLGAVVDCLQTGDRLDGGPQDVEGGWGEPHDGVAGCEGIADIGFVRGGGLRREVPLVAPVVDQPGGDIAPGAGWAVGGKFQGNGPRREVGDSAEPVDEDHATRQEGLIAQGEDWLDLERGRGGGLLEEAGVVLLVGPTALVSGEDDVGVAVVVGVPADAESGEVTGRGGGEGGNLSPVAGSITAPDTDLPTPKGGHVEVTIHIHVEDLGGFVGARDWQTVGEILPGPWTGPAPYLDAPILTESQVIAAIVIHIPQSDALEDGSRQVTVIQGEIPSPVSQVDRAVLVGDSEIGVPIAIDVAEDEVHIRVALQEAEGLYPGAIPLVQVDVHTCAAAEGDRAEVQVAVVVDVGEIAAEHPPVLAVGSQAIVPGGPVHASAITQGDFEQLVAKVARGVVVVHTVTDIDQPVAINIAQGDAAIPEVTVLQDSPVPRPVAEPDHDPMLVGVDVGGAMIADGDQVEEAVAIYVAHLDFGAPALHAGRDQPGGRFNVGECICHGGAGGWREGGRVRIEEGEQGQERGETVTHSDGSSSSENWLLTPGASRVAPPSTTMT